VFATLFIGAGFNVIFQQCINFLVDTYGVYAASAVSANTFLRSIMAAGLPLAAQPMFHNLGVGPAMSILGAVATIAIPVPFVFMKYGLLGYLDIPCSSEKGLVDICLRPNPAQPLFGSNLSVLLETIFHDARDTSAFRKLEGGPSNSVSEKVSTRRRWPNSTRFLDSMRLRS
jgi:hypothetical protein